MNSDLEKKLVADFPKLYIGVLASSSRSRMSSGFECDDGWFDLIYDLSKKIEKKNDSIKNPDCYYVAAQVKEKFGGLRFYIHNDDYDVREWVREAEEASLHICEICGSKKDIKQTKGYIKTLCGDCYTKFINK